MAIMALCLELSSQNDSDIIKPHYNSNDEVSSEKNPDGSFKSLLNSDLLNLANFVKGLLVVTGLYF